MMWLESDEFPGTAWHHDGNSWTGWFKVDGVLHFTDDVTLSHPPRMVRFTRAATPPGEITEGDLVRHPTFGFGLVREVSSVDGSIEYAVSFHDVGFKRLAAPWAKLEKVV
jgi:hypothetical protein